MSDSLVDKVRRYVDGRDVTTTDEDRRFAKFLLYRWLRPFARKDEVVEALIKGVSNRDLSRDEARLLLEVLDRDEAGAVEGPLLADPAEPEAVAALRRRVANGDDFPAVHTRQFVRAALSDARVVNALTDDSKGGQFMALRGAVQDAIVHCTYLTAAEARDTLVDYDRITGWVNPEVEQVRNEIARIERELAEARERLARLS